MKSLILILISSVCVCAADLNATDPKQWKNWEEAPIRSKNGVTIKLLISKDSDSSYYVNVLKGDFYLIKVVEINGVDYRNKLSVVDFSVKNQIYTCNLPRGEKVIASPSLLIK